MVVQALELQQGAALETQTLALELIGSLQLRTEGLVQQQVSESQRCCVDNKRYFGSENSRFNFTVSLVLHSHLDSSDDSDNQLENLTACELQNQSNCQSKSEI